MNQHVYYRSLMSLRYSLPNDEARRSFDMAFSVIEKSPVVSWGLNSWLGMFGVDRFRIGQTWPGIGKIVTYWLTVGYAPIWLIVDWFLTGNATRRWNLRQANDIATDLGGTAVTVE